MVEYSNDTPDQLPIRSDHYLFDLANNIAPSWFKLSNYSSLMTAAHLHHHPNAEFIYLMRGQLFVEVNRQKITLDTGDLLIVNPYELHAAKFNADVVVEYCYATFDFTCFSCFSNSIAEPLKNLRLGNMRFQNIVKASETADELGRLVCDIYKCNQSSGNSVTDLMLISKLCQLMSLLIDKVGLIDINAEGQEILPRDSNFINKIVHFLDENYTLPLSTAEIAAKLGYNKSYFCTLFKRCFGTSFTNYLTHYRIRRAAVEYHSSGLNTSEIAENVGFSDYSHFSRSFRQLVGVPPSVYFKPANPPPFGEK
ncbi:MAG: AraC family transcriptional regulator [Clostridiales bacterium]|nr:AraC family transcriptional regulator [Clostridiales bacterium]